MMLGFQNDIADKLINNNANIKITPHERFIERTTLQKIFFDDTPVHWVIAPSGRRDDFQIYNQTQWYDFLKKDKQVAAFAPQLNLQAVLSKGILKAAITLIGTQPDQELKVTHLNKYMLKGNLNELIAGSNHIILGEGLLYKLGAHVGGYVFVSINQSATVAFKVVGMFSEGIETIDNTTAYVNLSDAQKINHTPSKIDTINVRLHNLNDAHQLAKTWRLNHAEKIQSWDVINTNVLSVFKTQNAVRYFITTAILLVASFGIYNVLSVLINQKKREIAILRAIGFAPKDIRFLFFCQGLIVGGLGGLLGIGLGYLACRYIQTLPLFKYAAMQVFLHLSYSSVIFIYGLLLAILSALVASFFPANKASKMTPIDIIRESGS